MILFETIKIENRQFCKLHAHTQRMNASRKALFNSTKAIALNEILHIPEHVDHSLFRCRIDYNATGITSIQFFPYQFKVIKSVKLITISPDFDYSHKFSDRRFFEQALKENPTTDEVIFVQNGLITDCTFANLVFDDGSHLFTPKQPLLKGTQRNALLQNNALHEADIRPTDLPQFKRFACINAMRSLDESLWINNKTLIVEP